MPEVLQTDDFLTRSAEWPVIDVRAPVEFALGHIPGAVNVPLFDDDERAQVGTTYKRAGRGEAVMTGLRFIGRRLDSFGRELLSHAGPAGNRALVHCWRGGMRSASVAWLMETLGCRVATLDGGYKAFRNRVLEYLDQPRRIHVIAGLTGSGKTEVLHELAKLGARTIDLEAIARHKGSAFGALGQEPQPTQQQFENELALAWRATPSGIPLWLEDESRSIGKVGLPTAVWRGKQAGVFHFIDVPAEDRVQYLCKGYAGHPREVLAARIDSIRKRLGGNRVKEAVDALDAGDPSAACRILLAYYDKAYRHCLENAVPASLQVHRFDSLDPARIASTLAAKMHNSHSTP
ncbi:MAG TPA: tRNA 2-selenouridine(34) synthase MnmH [Luteolibacter sp.]|nr:tRNA 2-selenouridine(34) synthase MnmH [Luteolibacter sp.]